MRRSHAVRITGGEMRGLPVPVPGKVRPTEGRVREALFSIWQERIEGARFLDLFAGSGLVALEAVSRGVLTVACVEADLRAVRSLVRTCRRLARGVATVRRVGLPGGLSGLAEEGWGPFDLIFADPPYRFSGHEGLLRGVEPLLAPDGELAVEHSSRSRLPDGGGGLVRTDRRRYGESSLSFYRRL